MTNACDNVFKCIFQYDSINIIFAWCTAKFESVQQPIFSLKIIYKSIGWVLAKLKLNIYTIKNKLKWIINVWNTLLNWMFKTDATLECKFYVQQVEGLKVY